MKLKHLPLITLTAIILGTFGTQSQAYYNYEIYLLEDEVGPGGGRDDLFQLPDRQVGKYKVDYCHLDEVDVDIADWNKSFDNLCANRMIAIYDKAASKPANFNKDYVLEMYLDSNSFS